jgi:AhpD family alkylhydroperoxidase
MSDVADRPGRNRYLTSVGQRRPSSPVVTGVRRDLLREFGVLAPPMTLHEPLPSVLTGAWAVLYESNLAVGDVSRDEKESINVAISQVNECPYCVDVHVMALQVLGAGSSSRQLRQGEPTDPRLRDIAAWAKATREPDSRLLAHPPFPGPEAVEAVGTALAFHYLNRMVSVFLPEQPIRGLRGPFAGIVRTYTKLVLLGPASRRAKPKGRSLRHLESPEAADQFSWAAARPEIQIAYTALDRAVETEAARRLPGAGLARVAEVVSRWDASAPPMRRAWVDEHLEGLEPADRAAAVVGLLTALAPYQVDRRVVEAFQTHVPGDEALLALVAFGAWRATRRLSEWTVAPLVSSGSSRTGS